MTDDSYYEYLRAMSRDYWYCKVCGHEFAAWQTPVVEDGTMTCLDCDDTCPSRRKSELEQ